MKAFRALLGGVNELVLIVGVLAILMVLFTPIPAPVLDFLLLLNFSVALLVLLLTFYTEKPLSFSTFPTLLLITTLFRLSLNVSATRLILSHGNAGKVIDAVGTHVVSGNYVIGLVVFLILIAVQYLVVTNGSQRVAEVAARFTLDSLPGKQMSIDADLNMGAIDQEEAKRRRAELERESNFYGAMDGASKFVKGDAIAGIIIILINIVGGLSIGIVQRGMPWQEALHRYTLLTVGDGIVTQIPSLIIAVAAGILITRAATDSRLGQEISRQFSAHPRALVIAVLVLAGLALLPGLPLLPIAVVIALLLAMAWFSAKHVFRQAVSASEAMTDAAQSAASSSPPNTPTVYDKLGVHPFEIRVGKTLADAWLPPAGELPNRLLAIRTQMALDMGVVVPDATLTRDIRAGAQMYQVLVNGVTVGQGELEPTQVLAIGGGAERARIEGKATREPTYGLPAVWVAPSQRAQARTAGYTVVEPETVLTTHIQEICKQQAPEFLTRAEVERLIERRRAALGSLIDDLVPSVLTYSDIQRVLQLLLREQVSIRNLEQILEVLVDYGRQVKSPEELVERVRERLGAAICDALKTQGNEIHVMTLAPEFERGLLLHARQREPGAAIMSVQDMDRFVMRVAKECEASLLANRPPVLLCAAALRRTLKGLLTRAVPQVHVLSVNEVSLTTRIISSAVIDAELTTLMEGA